MDPLIGTIIFFTLFFVSASIIAAKENDSTKQILKQINVILLPENCQPVDRTVANELKQSFCPNAKIVYGSIDAEKHVLKISVADEKLSDQSGINPQGESWMYFKLNPDGSGELIASKANLLYALFCQIRDEWLNENVAEFASGKLICSDFKWITGRDELLTGRTGFQNSKGYAGEEALIEKNIQELARIGCSHVIINELAKGTMETGPAGEIYYRFYEYTPDFDQYVETDLIKGTYPPEFLNANLTLLKTQARLAAKYGLTPGMYVANPRTMPESFFQKYPFLRGARVDHTFRSFKPRYTMTLAHPLVRWHYSQIIKKILTEVPEIKFMQTLINDSGAGFEYTSSLYPGKNGGPYIVREWRPDAEIAEAAAKNVINYYRLLRDAAREVSPDFRIITTLKNIAEEADIILSGMDNGIDRLMMSQRADVEKETEWKRTKQTFEKRGSFMYAFTSIKGSPYILGVPSPWWAYNTLKQTAETGFDRIDTQVDLATLATYDINREVLRAFQFEPNRTIDDIVMTQAKRWVGEGYAARLIDIWKKVDKAAQAAPVHPLYGTLGFTWYRFWARPFVPDISKIPVEDREYYEKYMITVFNNPHNIDFGADALWQMISPEQGDQMVADFDSTVWGLLDEAITKTKEALTNIPENEPAKEVFTELRDRLIAYRCYCMTLRNIGAWVAGVHGYIGAKDANDKSKRLEMVRDMVAKELSNTKELLTLWENSTVDFMPIYQPGENMHHFGENLGLLLKKKIELMEKYGDSKPHIDPDFMWRMPADYPVSEDEYLKYK